MTALKVILIVIGAIILIQALVRIIRKRWHFPAPSIIGRFLDSNLRRRLQPPDKIIERSGIKPGMTVIDLGCGSGALTALVARAVGKEGKWRSTSIKTCQREGVPSGQQCGQSMDLYGEIQ